MTRLQSELNRLYLAAPAPPGGDTPSFFDTQGRVRALVLEVVQPATWASLSAVWQGVQAELDLPAPAIAVSGTDGLQLWFSLEAPIDVDSAHAFLDSLRSRFLADVPLARVRLMPDPATPTRHATLVPALTEATGNWSAFVAPDLAAVFSDTPWLDVEPGDEGQAALLRGLRSIQPSAFEAAVARPDAQAHEPAAQAPAAAAARSEANESTDDPRRFLLRVMNDESAPLELRIEAAKALLPRH